MALQIKRETVWGALLCSILAALDAAGASSVEFNRDILPILSNNCFACHGPDAPARKAGLRLDQEEQAKQPLESGKTPIVPGDAASSLVMERVLAEDPAERMPPPETGKTLSQEERERLARWIDGGAAWQPHWAFIPPERLTVPGVADAAGTRNPIDNFIRVRLENEGLSPSPEADRYTLLRRASLALTGLPPTPAEIAGFTQDTSPQAYEALVDRLLASPRYGEHMARYWLDLARYADTNGYAADIERTMWRYRDWVIAAFNANMPFDRFTVEQLAGDLLPEPTLEQRIATGFNRNHPIMMEGGAIFEEYRVMNVVDRVDTTATTWLGLTMKCAQCHDHKYDPISQREFYALYAFFNNVTEEESRLFGTELDGNSLPRIPAPLPAQVAELARLDKAIESVRAEKLRPITELDAGQQRWEAEERAIRNARWTALDPIDLPVDSGESEPEDSVTLLGAIGGGAITALRLDVLPTPEGAENDVVLSEVALYGAPMGDDGEARRIAIAESDSLVAGAERAYDGDGDTAWHVGPAAETASVVFALAEPLDIAGRTRIRLALQGDGLADHTQRLRVFVADEPEYLPATLGPWWVSGPHTAPSGNEALVLAIVDPAHVDLAATRAEGAPLWTAPKDGLSDGKRHNLTGKTCATLVLPYCYSAECAPNGSGAG